MATESMLTTIDNPYDPFTMYDDWHSWDMRHDYNTQSFLARILNLSLELSYADQNLEIEAAIDEIVRENVSGMHIKVEKEI